MYYYSVREIHIKNAYINVYKVSFFKRTKIFTLSTGTLLQKFYKLCIIVLGYHKILRHQKISQRYGKRVFFTLTRSFFYWRTRILKNLLFVVYPVFFFFTYRCCFSTVNIRQFLTSTNSTVRYTGDASEIW